LGNEICNKLKLARREFATTSLAGRTNRKRSSEVGDARLDDGKASPAAEPASRRGGPAGVNVVGLGGAGYEVELDPPHSGTGVVLKHLPPCALLKTYIYTYCPCCVCSAAMQWLPARGQNSTAERFLFGGKSMLHACSRSCSCMVCLLPTTHEYRAQECTDPEGTTNTCTARRGPTARAASFFF